MKTKTFKIGESAIGGLIKIDYSPNNKLKISFLDYYTKKLVPFYGITADLKLIDIHSRHLISSIDDCLNEGTTSYYADKVKEYIYTKMV